MWYSPSQDLHPIARTKSILSWYLLNSINNEKLCECNIKQYIYITSIVQNHSLILYLPLCHKILLVSSSILHIHQTFGQDCSSQTCLCVIIWLSMFRSECQVCHWLCLFFTYIGQVWINHVFLTSGWFCQQKYSISKPGQ